MLTRNQLLELNAAVNRPVTVKEPGEVLTDLDGTPTAVGPTTKSEASIFGAIVSTGEVAAAGLTPTDLPNLRII